MIRFVLVRVLTLVLAMGTAGAVAFAPAQPALAATCRTAAMVYEDESNIGQGLLVKTETDPVNGPFYALGASASDGVRFVTLGGNGLRPGTRPTWDVYSSNGQFIGTLDGHTAGSNCVSNELSYQIFGSAFDVYVIKANYVTGNSNKQISQQNHFTVRF